MENTKPKEEGIDIPPKSESHSVFISHDTRDAEIAEAFSKLLKSVSAGMLKSFRSSDNKGTQGIEFGIEWYPKIIDKLHSSSDVVCILTELSINRPWILFEAGMAKGKLNTTILGIAVGVQLGAASTGPFAQFQNCGDDINSLTKLVNQLVKKLPNSEPDEEVIRQQVEQFKFKTEEILKGRNKIEPDENGKKNQDGDSTAKLFEEIKLMFKELPSRIENLSIKSIGQSRRKLHPMMLEELMFSTSKFINPKVRLQILLSPLKSDFPWIYDAGMDAADKAMSSKNMHNDRHFIDFIKLVEYTFEHPIIREFSSIDDEYSYKYLREISYILDKSFRDWAAKDDSPISRLIEKNK
jgi:hypothetical protein